MEAVYTPPNRIQEIIPVWLDAFPDDTKDDVEKFIKAAYAPGRCLMMAEDGKPVSMVFLLPATLELANGLSYPIQYIYAASTINIYRGRGIFGELMQKALEAAKSEGIAASFLCPAEPSLFSYYAKFGYRPFFYVKTEHYTRTHFLKGFDQKNLTAFSGDSAAQRSRVLYTLPVRVNWPDDLVRYATDSAEKTGGGCVAVNGGWALCEQREKTLWIKEWLCEPRSETSLRNAVTRRFQEDEILLRRPVNASIDESGEPFGMLCPLTDEAKQLFVRPDTQFPYMGLAFD